MPSEIPQPDHIDPSEVWKSFGLAFYNAQVLENGVLNLVVGARVAGKPGVTTKLILDLYKHFEKNTFGQVLNVIPDMIPDNIKNNLQQVLKKRNYLAHRFFKVHAFDLLSDDGRHKMIVELEEISSFLVQVDLEFNPIWEKVWADLGFTQEGMDRELERMGIKRSRDQK